MRSSPSGEARTIDAVHVVGKEIPWLQNVRPEGSPP
jgi:hypothetical protein